MEIKKYTKEVEDLFIQFFITDPEIFVRCIGILDKDHFQDPTNKKTIEFMKEHCKTYSRLPTHEQMFAITGKTVEKIQEYDPSYSDWCLLEFEEFSRYRQMEKVIYKAPDMIAEGRYGEVEKQIKDAVSIGLVKDLGTDYFSDPIARLTAIRDNKSMISTGWKTVDKILYGGLNRGELTIFCAQSGHGKSIYLQNLAVNYAQQGLNVVYITLELSENLCSMRLDAMTTGYATTEIMRNMEDVALKVSSFKKRHGGTLRIKQLKNNCTSNDIKAYIKEYETQTKVKVDVIIVDYLDLCMPSDIRISPSDLFVKDKYVSENLRALAIELNVILLTASQLNRCLTLDTLVEVNGEKITIGNVKVGDYLTSAQGPVQVTEVLPIIEQAVFEVTTKSGKKIKCSAKHRFPTDKGLLSLETGMKIGNKLQILRSSDK